VNHEDEQLKAIFGEVGGQPGPPLGLTADGIARRGRRIRLARWGAGVAASLVVAAAITTTIALTAHREVEPATPPAPEFTTTDVPTTTTTPTTLTTTTTPVSTATSTGDTTDTPPPTSDTT
jgi:hypothetical protein